LKDAPADEYLTDRLTDEAIKFVNRNRQRRWFLYLTHFAVHTPLQGKPELVAKYKAKPKGQLHDHAVMAAMIESVDRGIGRLIASIDVLGLTQQTAIVFSSDNGGYGPATSMSPLKGYKGTYYEGGIREPLFVVWPTIVRGGEKSDVPVIHVDLYPTFCEMTGAKLPADQPIDGQSLLPLLRADESFAQRAMFWHFPAYLQSYSRTDSQRDPLFRSRPCGIIRRGDWKLHQYFEDGAIELYNLRADIGERNNLANTDPLRAKELLKEMVAWRKNTGAPVPRDPNPNHDPDAEAAAIDALLNR